MNRPSPSELRTTRKAARLSQTAAAALLSVSRSTWARWESEGGQFAMPVGQWIAFGYLLRDREPVTAD